MTIIILPKRNPFVIPPPPDPEKEYRESVRRFLWACFKGESHWEIKRLAKLMREAEKSMKRENDL